MSIGCGSQIELCDCPVRFDTYVGCSHGCRYCFVQRKTDISKIKADDCVKQLREFIAGARCVETKWCDWDIPLHWGGMSDPFQPLERRARVSYKALQVFAETGYPFIVSTKGKLIAEDEYLSLIRKCNCAVQISMVCSRYDVLEKGAPSYEERLEMCRKLSPVAKRLIVRLQPYMVEIHKDVMETIPRLKDAGVFGVTIEGMKFIKKKDGLVRVGGDFVYPKEQLERRYREIKDRCHELGLAFYCAENRLRQMGDAMCCCGVEGLEGFKPNKNNLIHLFCGDKIEFSEKQKEIGSAGVYGGVYQRAGYWKLVNERSYADMTLYTLRAREKHLQEIFGKSIRPASKEAGKQNAETEV